MSVQQATLDAAPRRPLTATERNWLTALAIVIGSALVFAGIGLLEKQVGHAERERALVWHGVESSMRFLALSHFLVALVYMSTSQRMKQQGSWLWFFGLLGAGAIACVGFSRIGGLTAPLSAVAFYVYFLLHEFRDQARFFRANGDAPQSADPKRAARNLFLIPLLIFGVIAATFLAGAAFRIGGARRYDQWFDGMAQPLRATLGLLPWAIVAVGALAAGRRLSRNHPGGLRGYLRDTRPILIVFAGIYLVLMTDIVVTGRVYAIVTLHVTAWYVFILHQNASRPAAGPAPRPWTLRWVRTTNAGFNAVHLSMAALVILAGVVWAYGFDNAPSQSAFRLLLSRDAFPYWTIMHVTVSWIPR